MTRSEFIRITTRPTGSEYFAMATVGIKLPKTLKFADDLTIIYSIVPRDVDDTGGKVISTTGIKRRGVLVKRQSSMLGSPAYHTPEHVAGYSIFDTD